MRTLQVAFTTELMKLRRSNIVWISIAIFIWMPLMIGLMAYIIQHPEIASKLGIVGMKAQMFGRNDWQGYLAVLVQTGGGLGLVGAGFVAAYIFGREYTERTLKDILALPIARSSIVFAKFIVVFIWSALLHFLLYISGIGMGLVMHINGWDQALIHSITIDYTIQSLLTIIISTPVAYLACVSRGIIAPLGFCIGTVILSNFVGVIGLGPIFPWAIPALSAMHSSDPSMHVGVVGYTLFTITAILGFWLTLQHWIKADHH